MFLQNLWYDLQTGVLVSYVSGYETVNAPLDKIPVFVRGGSILGTQAPGQTTVERYLYEKNTFQRTT